MPKVVGHDPTNTHRCTCKNCSSVIEFTMNETVEKKYAYDYLGDYEVGRFVQCPKCGADILVRNY